MNTTATRFILSAQYVAPRLRQVCINSRAICLTSFTGGNQHQGYEDDGDIEY